MYLPLWLPIYHVFMFARFTMDECTFYTFCCYSQILHTYKSQYCILDRFSNILNILNEIIVVIESEAWVTTIEINYILF